VFRITIKKSGHGASRTDSRRNSSGHERDLHRWPQKQKRPHGASAPVVAAFSRSTAETTAGSAESSHARPTKGVPTTCAGEDLPVGRSCKHDHPELQAGTIMGIPHDQAFLPRSGAE